MNVKQVFGHSGRQRPIRLDPSKSYVVTRIDGDTILHANRGPVNVSGEAEQAWFEVAPGTINGVTAIRAFTNGSDGILQVRDA